MSTGTVHSQLFHIHKRKKRRAKYFFSINALWFAYWNCLNQLQRKKTTTPNQTKQTNKHPTFFYPQTVLQYIEKVNLNKSFNFTVVLSVVHVYVEVNWTVVINIEQRRWFYTRAFFIKQKGYLMHSNQDSIFSYLLCSIYRLKQLFAHVDSLSSTMNQALNSPWLLYPGCAGLWAVTLPSGFIPVFMHHAPISCSFQVQQQKHIPVDWIF